jgi:hypothetical protein
MLVFTVEKRGLPIPLFIRHKAVPVLTFQNSLKKRCKFPLRAIYSTRWSYASQSVSHFARTGCCHHKYIDLTETGCIKSGQDSSPAAV